MSGENQSSSSAQAPQESAKTPRPKDAGKYITAPDKIPPEIKAYVDKRLGQDENGNPRKDENDKVISPAIFPAKENGSYKGKVILNNDTYLVQTIGKDERTAVVHEKANLELMGERLKFRDQKQTLHNADIQVHYTDGKAKAYPVKNEQQQGGVEKQAGVEKAAINNEQMLQKAQEYAAENIKNGKSRDAFLKHFENVVNPERSQSPSPEAKVEQPNKQVKQPAKGKSQEAEMER